MSEDQSTVTAYVDVAGNLHLTEEARDAQNKKLKYSDTVAKFINWRNLKGRARTYIGGEVAEFLSWMEAGRPERPAPEPAPAEAPAE